MGSLTDYYNKLKGISQEEQDRALYAIVEGRRETVIDLNTNQLLAGKDSLGGFITPPYRSKLYAAFKLGENPKGVVDLRLTGDFHNSFFIKSTQWPLTIFAKDPKTKELTEKYSDEIFGLDKQSISTLAEDIKPDVIDYYRKLLRL